MIINSSHLVFPFNYIILRLQIHHKYIMRDSHKFYPCVVCRALKAFRCKVIGYSKSPRDYKSVSSLMDAHYSGADFSTAMEDSDYIVSCLPNTPHTTGILNRDTLAGLKQGTALINIGEIFHLIAMSLLLQ